MPFPTITAVYFQKCKAQNIVKFSFLTFLADFFKFCPQNVQHFDDVPIKSPKQLINYLKFVHIFRFEFFGNLTN